MHTICAVCRDVIALLIIMKYNVCMYSSDAYSSTMLIIVIKYVTQLGKEKVKILKYFTEVQHEKDQMHCYADRKLRIFHLTGEKVVVEFECKYPLNLHTKKQ